MMKQYKLKTEWTDVITIMVITTVPFLIPILIGIGLGYSWLEAIRTMKYLFPAMITPLGGFLINYFLLIPYVLFKQNSSFLYAFSCIILYLLLSSFSGVVGSLINPGANTAGFPTTNKVTAIGFSLAFTFINFLLIMAAISLRMGQRNRQLELERVHQAQEDAQNELMRLKGQLNPHFLFNTLNNISSLSAFDPDATQECIGRLSEMLRYVLYDSSTEKVPIFKDIEFMQNYMNLMQIRYEDTLTLDVNIRVSHTDKEIPPMLFISLLENAYKYGASSLHPCTLKLDLYEAADESLHFCLTNTLLTPQEMASKKHGGLGLVNLKKRLDLTYPGRYRFTYGEKDNTYQAEIHLS